MTIHKHAEVLRAIADGKEVEFQDSSGGWHATVQFNPLTHPDLSWRVKVPKKVTRWKWVYKNNRERWEEQAYFLTESEAAQEFKFCDVFCKIESSSMEFET